MSRLHPRARLAVVALALALVAVLAVVLRGGDDPYTVRMVLPEAGGLEDGSEVQVGGLTRGRVELGIEEPGDRIVATLKLDKGVGPISQDASARIQAQNFLGRKRVALDPGKGKAAPSGWQLPADRIGTSTDLDQVLGVFDLDTRTRMQIMLSELGEATVGRKADISKLIDELPAGLDDAGGVLAAIKTDTARMHGLLDDSDAIVSTLTRERKGLDRTVDTLGQAAETSAGHRVQLRQTLASAPGALTQLRGFLGDLQSATTELGPAARQLTAAAPAVTGALDQVPPFTDAARPTLRKAVDAAPTLTKLADGATPVVRQAGPTLRALATTGRDLQPVSHTLDNSADNVIAVLDNWSHAIQFRDGLSHVFRGEASFSPDLVLSAVDRLAVTPKQQAKAQPKPAAPPAAKPAEPVRQQVDDAVKKLPGLPDQIKKKLPAVVGKVIDSLPAGATPQQVQKAVQDAVGGLTGTGAAPQSSSESSDGLLDFLLGS